MNIRVILLERISRLQKGCFDIAPGSANCLLEQFDLPEKDGAIQGPWMVMGHFDALYTYRIETKGGMFCALGQSGQKIAKLNSDKAYFHPLHLIMEEDDSGFWGEAGCSWYLTLARIHFSETVGVDKQSEVEWLKQQFPEGADAQIYYTLELSDIVLAMKSDQLSTLLKFNLELRHSSKIGKVYTYSCVDYAHIKDTAKMPSEENISFASVRFSVSDFAAAKPLMDEAQSVLKTKQWFSVTGVDDVALFRENFPVGDLVDLYRKMFIRGEGAFQDLGSAISAVTTRIGVQWTQEDFEPNRHSAQDRLRVACETLLKCNEDIQNRARENQDSQANLAYNYWLSPLSELTKLLVRMSDSVVLDEFVYVMLPSARVFLNQVDVALRERGTPPQRLAQQGNWFINNWTTLMENIMRMESQLVHHPEVRPVLYNVPVAVLEYTMAFLDRCCSVVDEEETASFLLVPCLCEQIEARELFEVGISTDREGAKSAGLVLIKLPLHTIYDSQKLQSELCHELNHFVGQRFRHRKERLNFYIKAAAVIAAKFLFPSAGYHPDLIRALEDRVAEAVGPAPEKRIRECYPVICGALSQIFRDRDHYLNFTMSVLRNATYDLQKLNFSTSIAYPRQHLTQTFAPVLKEITNLFRETFADVCMMYLLDVDPVFYVKNLLHSLAREKMYVAEYYAIRICTCLKVLGHELPEKSRIDSDELSLIVYNHARELWELLERGTIEPTNCVVPVGAVRALQQYLELCYQSISDPSMGLNQNKVQVIRNMYKMDFSKLEDFAVLNQEIERYRKKLISYDE